MRSDKVGSVKPLASSPLARFVNQSTPEEQAEVYRRVFEKVDKDQQAVISQAERGSHDE
ncbi:hypothetical protein [Ferrimonas marina]|uniref:Uncharacterized protein n=1 Tax=Ferrimonas marina TaxID=299255 RepID=A0A1M5U9S6_9GAMM|nr:hypothetical protein [Ferrimonas marina]SHH59680.1 hypothetical protein SAMN02745129_2467 [Ferrimonas marina]